MVGGRRLLILNREPTSISNAILDPVLNTPLSGAMFRQAAAISYFVIVQKGWF